MLGWGEIRPIDMPHHKSYEQVQDYHNDMCVTKWAKRLASPKSCVAYLAGMEYQQPHHPDSSLAELEQQCAKMRKSITVDFIGELCSRSNDAMGDVWQSLHGNKKGAPAKKHSHGDQARPAGVLHGTCPHTREECPHCGGAGDARRGGRVSGDSGGLQQCLRRARADPHSSSGSPDRQAGRYWNVL